MPMQPTGSYERPGADWSMSQVEGAVLSYAQNSEDVLLSRVLKDTSGIYVDVGACNPIID